jgi:fructose-1-phosphate kinase PfkB-like protein
LLVNVAKKFEASACPPRLKPRNTVGAGDALLAAVAREIELRATPEEWLATGVAIGSAATQYAAGICHPL